mgnify:FL=1
MEMPRLRSRVEPLVFRVEYVNGDVTYKEFKTKEDAQLWKHGEGDHLHSFFELH